MQGPGVYIYIYTHTHTHIRHTLMWILIPFVHLLSLAGVPAYTPQPVLLFSVIWETLCVGLNDADDEFGTVYKISYEVIGV